MWPPPKPPSSVDVSDLPSDLQPSRYTEDNSRSERECQKAKAEEQTISAKVKEQMQHELQSINNKQKEHPACNHTSVPGADGAVQSEKTREGQVTDAKEALWKPSAGNTDEAKVDGSDTSSVDKTSIQQPKVKHRTVQNAKQSANSDTYEFIRRPLYLFDPTMWTDHIDDEAVYESVDESSNLMLPDTVLLGDRPNRREVAMWGEQLVKLYLERLAKNPRSDIRNVIWMNEDQEAGTPYDLILEVDAADCKKKTAQIFIEVKTTESSDKGFFEISAQEFEFALAEQQNYHIYRVLNAGKSDVKLKRLVNLAEKMKRKQVCLFLAV